MSLSHFTITPVLPVWFILILFGVATVFTLTQYKGLRDKLGKRRAGFLILMRLIAMCLIVFFALNPSLVTRKKHKISPAVALVVDTSWSMGASVSGENGTRLDIAKARLLKGEPSLLKSLTEKFRVNLYGLADSLVPLAHEDLESLKPGGAHGDFNSALKALSGQNDVVVLLSDGKVQWHPDSSQSLPTLTLPLGSSERYRDILIKKVQAPPIAFRDREVGIDVTVKAYGFAGTILPVVLKDSVAVLGSQSIQLPEDSKDVVISFPFVPKDLGLADLSISIPEQVGEQNYANNYHRLALKVVRDKIRILMVSGTPSMNYRFMRSTLKRDPSIDLLSFVILRNPSDILNVRPHEQSLIPFPVEALFLKELTYFDLVIFDNFNYSLFLSPEHLESIRNFVKSGGSFAVIGGPNLFMEGPQSLSPVGELLPFRFVEREFYQRDVPVSVRLNRSHADHPILWFSESNEDALRRFWQDLPALDGINRVDAGKSSTVLIESGDGIPWPILMVSEFGKGRVLALTTDYAWKWYMGMVGRGEGNQHYLRFVHRMIRWLTKDPNLDPVRISLPEGNPTTGQPVEVRVQLSAKGLTQPPDPVISDAVFDPAEVQIESTLKHTPRPGEYRMSFVPQIGGMYRIRIETPVGNLEESMMVSGALDNRDAAPDDEQLRKISASTGGRYISQGDTLLSDIEAFTRDVRKEFIESKHFPMWATPPVMAVVLSLLSAEWYFRRRWGLA